MNAENHRVTASDVDFTNDAIGGSASNALLCDMPSDT